MHKSVPAVNKAEVLEIQAGGFGSSVELVETDEPNPPDPLRSR
jgi:hypothetical protein